MSENVILKDYVLLNGLKEGKPIYLQRVLGMQADSETHAKWGDIRINRWRRWITEITWLHCTAVTIVSEGGRWKKGIRSLFTLVPKPAVSMPSIN